MKIVDYWFFVRDEDQFKWAIIHAPELPLDDAKAFIEAVLGKPVLNIGYGTKVPHEFRLLPKLPIELENC
ncbi:MULTISPECIES: hypothetical protein [unclassified Sporosarcina]|uniref:hypothetical protein n=1 Tax=unclassified Sporosarcina TaxID=2647733 RepID=UPI001A90EFE3|nr:MULTISPECIES: hypothetical protein [unclassified Sporosarcina]MBO0588170.1 hypothetical protein [Sporosarcina sp. E16_8]MBO0601924.1 hypothetical protein [Sporosarcina sp. E16_3]